MAFLPDWTILVYLNAKNELEPQSFKAFEQMAEVGSSDNVRILVEYGRPQQHYPQGETPPFGGWSKVIRFAVGKGMRAEVDEAVEDLGQANMADPATLADFVEWGLTWPSSPSTHNMLVIWSPGPPRQKLHNGLWYVSHDEDTGDNLYMRDVQEVLSPYKDRLDVIGLDAGLTAMLENAYALRDCGSILVASEDVQRGEGWDYARFLRALGAERHASPDRLARLIVQSYRDSHDDDAATLSAVDLTKTKPLADAVSKFGHLPPDGDARRSYFGAIRQARNACADYGYGPESGVSVNSIDLGRFLDELGHAPDVEGIAKMAATARSALDDLVLDNYASPARQGEFGSHGVAIYFPGAHLMYHLDPDYDAYRPTNPSHPVQFVDNEQWSALVHAYMTWLSYPD
jgi:hypothetical protein